MMLGALRQVYGNGLRARGISNGFLSLNSHHIARHWGSRISAEAAGWGQMSSIRRLSNSRQVLVDFQDVAQEGKDAAKLGLKKQVVKSRANERVVLWKLYGTFHKHNTLLSLVAVVEDLDFMEKNSHLSYNEKVLYYLELPHQLKLHVSAGQLGFRKAQRAEYEAGYQVSARMFKLIEEKNIMGPGDKIELVMKDFGKGREAFVNALQGKEGSKVRPHVTRISDNTTLKFGGSRSKHLRRL